MKSESRLSRWLTGLFLLLWIALFAAALFSWVGSIYGLPVHNLLSTDGLRWLLRSAIPLFLASPLGNVLVVLMGAGPVCHSGLLSALGRLIVPRSSSGTQRHKNAEAVSLATPSRLSLRQRRALIASLTFFTLYVLLVLLCIFGPHGILLGITGGLAHSPFSEGFPLLLALGLALTGTLYGCFVGKYSFVTGLFQGSCHLFRRMAPALVLLFFSTLLFAVLDYTVLSPLLSLQPDTTWRIIVESLIYYLPFLLCVAEE